MFQTKQIFFIENSIPSKYVEKSSPITRDITTLYQICSSQMPKIIVIIMLFLSSVAIHAYTFSSFHARYMSTYIVENIMKLFICTDLSFICKN